MIVILPHEDQVILDKQEWQGSINKISKITQKLFFDHQKAMKQIIDKR